MSDLIQQLEDFKVFIENTNPSIVSNIEMRRKYYSEHPTETKKSDLYDKSTDIFKNIVIAFIQLNNNNAKQTIISVNNMLSSVDNVLNKNMWVELITKITNAITSSNLTISNTKENYAKLIEIIEKNNAGFLNEFIKYQNSINFSIEILDCLMYLYMNFKDIEDNLVKYMLNGCKDSFTELLKFINISVYDYQNLYNKFITNITTMTGYMKYVNEEIISVIEKQ